MSKLGVAINSFNTSNRSTALINSLNTLIDTHDIDCCIFHADYLPAPVPNRFALYQLIEMWDYNGIVIATDFVIAKYLIASPGPRQKFLYVSELEWAQTPGLIYNKVASVYCNEQLELIADNETIFKILSNCFKTPYGIMNNWNIQELEAILWK